MVSNNKSLSRRQFLQRSLAGAALLASAASIQSRGGQTKTASLRLGGPTFEKYQDPDGWVQAVKKLGYSAAYCPVGTDASGDVVRAYADAAKKADIVIAEVGVWNNPISPDEKARLAALAKCRSQLALADRIAARCCVNISGSKGRPLGWSLAEEPHRRNLRYDCRDNAWHY